MPSQEVVLKVTVVSVSLSREISGSEGKGVDVSVAPDWDVGSSDVLYLTSCNLRGLF